MASTSTLFLKIIPNIFSLVRSASQPDSGDEDSEEWKPSEAKTKIRKAAREPESKQLKPVRRTAPRSQPREPEDPKCPNPGGSLNPPGEEKSMTAKNVKNTAESGLPGTKMKQNNEGKKKRAAGGNSKKQQTTCPEEQPATTSVPSNIIKEEVRQTAVRIFTTLKFLPFKMINNAFQ